MLIGGYLLNVLMQNSSWSSLFAAVSSIGLFCVVHSVALPDATIYPFVRKMSTIIYFVHMYIWSFYYVLVYGEKTYGIDSFLVTTGICIAVAAVTIVAQEWYKNKKIKAIR